MIQIFDNALVFNPVTREWKHQSFSVENGKIGLVGKVNTLSGDKVINLRGARVIPGLIDAHAHIESSLLVPHNFGKVVLRHGVTTVIADPHEIANACGVDGLEFMIKDADASPTDIYFMLPSCVPATFDDIGGAVLLADDLKKFIGDPKVLGLGEVMNVPGVLVKDPDLIKKLKLFDHIDGHAPGISGDSLSRYVAEGIRTDHECTTASEAYEKLSLGMYILLREGGTAKNIAELSKAVTNESAHRFCFCTDDKHVDSLVREGSIDNCIRVAVKSGMSLETALQIATLSAAECFNLRDRGLLAPGRIADFCVLEESHKFVIKQVYKSGVLIDEIPDKKSTANLSSCMFNARLPKLGELSIPKVKGMSVIGIVPDEIITKHLSLTGKTTGISKIAAINRYGTGEMSVGFVKGLSMKKGAIASSVAHDAHNIIAAWMDDEDLLTAVQTLIEAKGGMVVSVEGKVTLLPLPIGGIMTDEEPDMVLSLLDEIEKGVAKTKAINHAFMHLSFLSLIVVPHLKITPKGLFDGDSFVYLDQR